ncbi:MAG: shikimate dehydrogenase [Bacteroidota bacterium]|nr:shikimate dehydrogenase [Bacteroidota bacterium]
MRLFGLIGYPLGHSFSAAFFNGKFKEEGIHAEYRNFPLEQIADFSALLNREHDLSGLNVTVPYKQEVISYLHTLSPTAEAIRAVNTISFRRREGRMELAGDNTDVIGFRRSLEEHLESWHSSALVLGTGGSSKAVLYVLEQLGIRYTMVSRTPGDRQITYGELGANQVAATTLIINTTPLGMHPRVDVAPEIPYETLTHEHLLFDLVYNPERTEFLSRGEKRGAKIVNGHAMLIYQAEASWDIWNR